MSIVRSIERWSPLAALGVLALLALVLWTRGMSNVYLVAVGICLVCVAGYVVWQHALDAETNVRFRNNTWYYAAVACIGWALMAWLIRTDPYIMPTAYFVFVAAASGCLFVYAVSGGRPGYILGAACFMILLHVFASNLLFPGLLGADPWSHMFTTTYWLGVAGTGDNPALTPTNMGGSYSLMHVYLRQVMVWTHLDYKLASLIFWSAPQVLGNVILVFFIGRLLFNAKIGSIASTLMANAGWVVLFGQWVLPSGIGVTLSLAAALVFVYSYQTRTCWSLVVLPILFAAAVFTSIVAVIWVAGTILLSGFVLSLVRRPLVALAPAALLVTGLWIGLSNMDSALIASPVIATQLPPGGGLTPNVTTTVVPPSVVATSDSIPLQETPSVTSVSAVPVSVPDNAMADTGAMVLNSLGMFLFVGLSVVGILILLRAGWVHKAWALLCLAVALIGVVPGALGIVVIEQRWWYLTEAVMTVPLALFLTRASRSVILVGVAACAVAILSFLSLMSTPVNTTNRLLASDLVVRYGFTAEELDGLDAARSYNLRTVGADPLYALYLNTTVTYNGRVRWLGEEIVDGNFTNVDADGLLLRESLSREPFGYGSGAVYNLEFDPVEIAKKQGYTEVWANKDIHLLMKESN